MTGHEGKNFPRPTRETLPFWEGCRSGELRLQHCGDCGRHQFYPRLMCSHCNSEALAWVRAGGTGTVSSFTVVRRPVSQAYAAETPYIVALIALTEGPTMMSNLVGCEPDDAAIGMAVEVVFEQWSQEITVPKFRPLLPRP